MPKVTPRRAGAFRNFLLMLPRGKDHELTLLKGHLLIEEQVRALIDRRLKNPSTLKEANSQLSAHQAIQLARAFFQPDHQLRVWTSIQKLNKLRNDIAHNLWTKSTLADKVEAWVLEAPVLLQSIEDPQVRFEMTLWALFEAISGLVEAPVAEIVELRGANTDPSAA